MVQFRGIPASSSHRHRTITASRIQGRSRWAEFGEEGHCTRQHHELALSLRSCVLSALKVRCRRRAWLAFSYVDTELRQGCNVSCPPQAHEQTSRREGCRAENNFVSLPYAIGSSPTAPSLSTGCTFACHLRCIICLACSTKGRHHGSAANVAVGTFLISARAARTYGAILCLPAPLARNSTRRRREVGYQPPIPAASSWSGLGRLSA